MKFRAVEHGSTFLLLNDQQVKMMAENLPRLCEPMCGNEQYGCKDVDFRLNTTGIIGVTGLYLDKQYISLRSVAWQYPLKMFHVVQNQLNHVLSYVTVALTSSTHVEPTHSASKHIVHPQLFEELKTLFIKKKHSH